MGGWVGGWVWWWQVGGLVVAGRPGGWEVGNAGRQAGGSGRREGGRRDGR